MRKRRIIAWVLVLAVVGSVAVLFSLSLPKRVVVVNQPKNEIPVGELYGEMKVRECFVAKHNNLSAVEVLLATYNKKNRGECLFHLNEQEIILCRPDYSLCPELVAVYDCCG